MNRIGLFIMLCAAAALGGVDMAGAVDIFVGGNKYASIQEYKAKRLKVILKDTFAISDEKELDFLIQEISKDNKRANWDNLSKEQLQAIIDGIKNNHYNAAAKGPDHDFQEMKQMLGEYLNDHKGVAPIIIDKNKVKTIIVIPGNKI